MEKLSLFANIFSFVITFNAITHNSTVGLQCLLQVLSTLLHKCL